MLHPDQIPPVDPGETLSRYILSSTHMRADRTVRPDAFMPHPHADLSLTRHAQATDPEIWNEGARVAGIRQKTLHGRADVMAAVFMDKNLDVAAAPVNGNPNHVNVKNWPADKSEQKLKALEIAAQARFLPTPPTTDLQPD